MFIPLLSLFLLIPKETRTQIILLIQKETQKQIIKCIQSDEHSVFNIIKLLKISNPSDELGTIEQSRHIIYTFESFAMRLWH